MGLGHVELAMVQAEAAKSSFGPFAINAQAPDEGNMHTLLHWGTEEQKQKYLKPLCDGVERVVLRDDRARGRGLRPDAHQDLGVPRRRRVGHQRPQVVHQQRAPRSASRSSSRRTEQEPDIPQAANTAFIVDLPSDGWTEVREVETMHGPGGPLRDRHRRPARAQRPDARRARAGPPARPVPARAGTPRALHALDRAGRDRARHDGRPFAQPLLARLAARREAGHPVDDRGVDDRAVPVQAHGAARGVQDRPQGRLQEPRCR